MGSPVPANVPAPVATRGYRIREEIRLRAPARALMRATFWWRAGPAILAGLISLAVLVAEPRTVDLAASVYRARIFGQAGFTIWDGNWYAGHYTLGYSVLLPPLAWLVGPLWVGALAAVASAAVFEPLARSHFGPRARFGALWFGAAAAAPLVSGRIPFGLGVALGLGALLAWQRGRPRLGVALAVGCSLASPVAGAFLALAGVAYALSGALRVGAAIAGAAAAPILLLAVLFPAEGHEPFARSAFLPIPFAAVLFAYLVPRRERALRIGAVLYAASCLAAYLIETPMGGNAVRLGALFGGPLLACALLARERPAAAGDRAGRARRGPTAGLVGTAVALALLAWLATWQWSPAIRDIRKVTGDPSTAASYYRPLLDRLAATNRDGARIEIPFTRSHWEAAEVAPRFPLARGWERQADIARNGLFYGGVLNPITYATWLTERGVRFVALPDAKPDYSSYRERALVESGLPYLRLEWRSRHWRVYRVTLPSPTVVSRGAASISLGRLGIDRVDLLVRTPGEATVRVAWSPYWRATGACVQRDGDWTRVIARRPGGLRMTMDFAPDRVVSHGRRCA